MTPPPTRREIWAWGMYDFANSAFATSILSVIYSVYFARYVVPEGGALKGVTLWNWANAISMILACASAPVIGAVTDYTAAKRKIFPFYWLAGAAACIAMRWVHPGEVALGTVLFITANVGFAGGNALYNAFLTELAPPGKMGGVSAFGWAVGYAGGGLCLLVNLLMIKFMRNPGEATRWGFAVAGLWWLVFALPFVLTVPERAVPRPRPAGVSLIRLGFSDVFRTLREVRRHRDLFLFLVAYLLFNEGVETVISNAAIFGREVAGMQEGSLVLCFLVIQGVAAVGALGFGWVADRVSGKKTILATLFVWLGVLGFAFFTRTAAMFWTLGIFVALVMGGTQAVSRSFFGQMTPRGKSAKFFGFFAIGGKFAAALGPLVFGTVAQLTGHMRWGIVSLAVFFVAGMALLCRVDERAGIRASGGTD